MQHLRYRQDDRISLGTRRGSRMAFASCVVSCELQRAAAALHARSASWRGGASRGQADAGSGRLRALVLQSIREEAKRSDGLVALLACGKLASAERGFEHFSVS